MVGVQHIAAQVILFCAASLAVFLAAVWQLDPIVRWLWPIPVVGFVVYPYMLVTVPAGHAGVLWKRFKGPGFYCLCIVPSGTVANTAFSRKPSHQRSSAPSPEPTNTLSTDAPPEAGIPADFGPHCAKASFAQSGALIVDADVIPTNAIGVVYLHYVYPSDGTFVGSNTGGLRSPSV